MIQLMIKNICENTNKIDSLSKQIKKTNTKIGLQLLLMGVGIYVIAKFVKDHETEIKELRAELDSITTEVKFEDTDIAEVKMELEDMA